METSHDESKAGRHERSRRRHKRPGRRGGLLGQLIGLGLLGVMLFSVFSSSPARGVDGEPWGEIIYGCIHPEFGGGWRGICSMNPDGSGKTWIAGGDGSNSFNSAAASPDGRKIAAISRKNTRWYDNVWVMNSDGTGQTMVTNSDNHNASYLHPAWSNDGTKVIFQTDRDNNHEIYSINIDGTGLTNLTNNPAYDANPTVSPDGRIAFSRSVGGEGEIYVMNADGTGQTNLSNTPVAEFVVSESYPDWSADGTKIVYRADKRAADNSQSFGQDIYVMNADGSGQTRLTSNDALYETNPRWSPDRTQIAFNAEVSGGSIWRMNADGSNTTRIPTANPDWSENLYDWQPLTGPLPAGATTTTTTTAPPPLPDPQAEFAPATDYSTGGNYNPWEVAVADFNGDGNKDMAVAAPADRHPDAPPPDDHPHGDVAVLLGAGDGTFGPPTNFYAGFEPRSVAVGDFNEDGKPDLAAGNSGGRGTEDVSLLLGAGDGTFAPPVFFAGSGKPGHFPTMLRVDDMNGDGSDDVVVTNFAAPPNQGDVSVLLGTGTGSLQPRANYPSGSGTSALATGDFNEDGIRDVVTTNLLGQQDMAVFLGTGGGILGPGTHFKAAGTNPNMVAVGDFNADGFDDIAVSLLDKDAVSVQLGTGTGSFGAGVLYPVGSRPYAVTVSDLNGDGRQDLAVANSGGWDSTIRHSYSTSVLLGTGTGAFGGQLQLAAGVTPYGITAADLNNDSWPDLAVANHFGSDDGGPGDVSVLLNTTTPPAPPRPVAGVTASSFGYHTNVSLFGGPTEPRGPAPTVALESTGGTQVVTDPDGASAVYGPAVIFESTELVASAKGTTGANGYVTTSASAAFVGPNPFTANWVHSQCTASGTLTGSTAVTKGEVILHDPNPNMSGEDGEEIVQVPVHPAPNTTYEGVVAGANDNFTIVFNEQTTNADGTLTVSAVHMYLEGPNAVGDLFIAQSTCGVTLVTSADLSVDTAESADPVRTRSNLTYTVTVTNNGPDEANGVTLASSSKGAAIVSATSNDGTCTVSKGKVKSVNCSLGSIASGSSKTVTIVVKTPDKPETVSLTSDVSASTFDPNSANNTDTEATTVSVR